MELEDELNIYDLDLGDPLGVDIPLTFVLSDFRNLDSRNGTYSKTISIPSTKVNDSLLAHSFDVTAEGFYDRNVKKKFRIERYGVLMLKGYMQLKEVKMENGYITGYEIALFGNNSEWFTSLTGKLRDLDLGTHTFSGSVVEASWQNNGDDDAGYVYPFIDFGALTNKSNATTIYVDYFVAGIFFKQIIKKMFENIGYSIAGIFNQKTQFRDLILVSPKDFRLNDEQLESRSFIAGLTEDVSFSVFSDTSPYTDTDIIPFNDDITGEFFDGREFSIYNYDPITYRYTVEHIGKYDVFADVKVTLTISPLPTVSKWYWTGADKPFFRLEMIKNGTTTMVSQTISANLGDINDGVYYTSDFVQNISFNLESLGQTLNTGDYIHIQLYQTRGGPSGAFGSDGFAVINCKLTCKIEFENSRFYNRPNERLIPGSEIELSQILPDWTQRDFLKYYLTNFHVIFDTNFNTREIISETRNDFLYDINDYENWIEKQDHLLEERIIQIEEGLSKQLNFKYIVDDNDDNIIRFNRFYKTEFGNKSITLKNEFLSGEQDVANLPYSLSINGYSFKNSTIQALLMPRMINQDAINEDIEEGGYGMSLDFEPRILIYDGLLSINTNGSTLFTLDGANSTQTSYPYCYSTKETSTKHDISLAFCNFKDISIALQANDKGLYDRFYADLIRQINFARLYIAYFKLSETDILNIDFRKPKLLMVNGSKTYFHLNRINDFLAGQDESTEVELLQIPFGYGDNSE